LIDIERDTHEKPAGGQIVELLRLQDIAARLEQTGRNRSHYAGSVIARQGQNKSVFQGMFSGMAVLQAYRQIAYHASHKAPPPL
jgi:hypothetical protein